MEPEGSVNRYSRLQVGGCCLPPYFTKKVVSILSAICHASERQRVAILKSSDHNIIRCIFECALNIIKGNVPINNKQVSKLKKYKNSIRKLVEVKNKKENKKSKENKINWIKKKKVILQEGGGSFLPLLLSPIIEIILSQLLKK